MRSKGSVQYDTVHELQNQGEENSYAEYIVDSDREPIEKRIDKPISTSKTIISRIAKKQTWIISAVALLLIIALSVCLPTHLIKMSSSLDLNDLARCISVCDNISECESVCVNTYKVKTQRSNDITR